MGDRKRGVSLFDKHMDKSVPGYVVRARQRRETDARERRGVPSPLQPRMLPTGNNMQAVEITDKSGA